MSFAEDTKLIPEYPSYQITNAGRVWSDPKGTRNSKGMWLSPGKSVGYLTVVLVKNGKHRSHGIHRLVLETYVGPCPDGMEACHNNGDRLDNRVSNLRWGTRQDNMLDAVKHGTLSRSHATKLTECDVRMIIYMYRTEEFTQQEIADIYGIHVPHVSDIVNGKRWKHLWRGYGNGTS